MTVRSAAFVYGTPIGVGGLGVQAGNALRALSLAAGEVHAIGPGPAGNVDVAEFANVRWHLVPAIPGAWIHRSPLRWRTGLAQWLADRRTGQLAGAHLARLRPDVCYAFTQVALESLRWARSAGVPSILESPNGHIANFRRVYVDESRHLCGAGYHGHPVPRMVARVEEEYRLADRIRVSSAWARSSLVQGGVPAGRVTSLQQRIDLERYRPAAAAPRENGSLRLCFVGSLDLRKGFVYLLRALRQVNAPVSMDIVGATGTRCCRRLLEQERQGLAVCVRPGDPRPTLARADLFVLPTLEDGSPFATAEAMACGVPVVTTDCNGGAEWLTPGRSGWIVPPRSASALAQVIGAAAEQACELKEMGREARLATEQRAGPECDRAVADWVAA